MRRPRRLRTHITLSAALLTVAVVALSGFVIALRIDHQDRAQVDRQLRDRATKVQADAEKPGALLGEDGKPEGARNDTNLLAGTEALTRVLSADTVVAQRGEGVPSSQRLPAQPGLSTVTFDGQDWRSFVEPTTIVPNGRLQLLQSLAPIDRRLHDNQRLIVLVAIAATLTAGLAAWLVSGLVLRPLERLRHGVSTIRPGDGAGQRLPDVRGQQEVTELATALNDTLERLQASMHATRRFTADAGHELRTPLTALGMDLETLRRNPDLAAARRTEMLDAMGREQARMTALLDGLQQLARGDAEALPQRTVVDIAGLLETAVRGARGRHPCTTYRLTRLTPATADGWEDGIRLAVDNLLDNAALHGRPDGTVEVACTLDGTAVRIVVDDDGPGNDPDHRKRLTERFARGATTRSSGSGLGLALVDQQARLHGGALVLGDAPTGGLRATLTIPRRTNTPNEPSSAELVDVQAAP